MSIVINGLTISQSSQFTMKDGIQESSQLEPNSASPVLKTPIVITLDPNFPYDLLATDFSVNATSVDENNLTPIRYMNVLSVDD
jgi:hypothetical protein